eukprot:gene14528-19505_t
MSVKKPRVPGLVFVDESCIDCDICRWMNPRVFGRKGIKSYVHTQPLNLSHRESLIVMAHYLNWSLAELVVIKYRKALSSHPKYYSWPNTVISKIKTQLQSNGEYAIYNASMIVSNSLLR